MAVAFSTDGDQVIQRSLDVKSVTDGSHGNHMQDWQTYFEVERCREWIEKNGFKKVALQFPDEYLTKSAAVATELSASSQADVVILADTSYGSCCVDEVAAEHALADAIIHFGRACLSPTQRLPVLYVFGQRHLDVTDCTTQLQSMLASEDEPVLLMLDVEYWNYNDKISKMLHQHYSRLIIPRLDIHSCGQQQRKPDSRGNDTCEVCRKMNSADELCSPVKKFGRRFCLPKDVTLDDCSVIYIGEENMFLTNLIMTCNKSSVHTYIPSTQTCRKEALNINKMLMKRFYLVEKTKDASIIGLLVGTLGVADYLTMINRLKLMIKQSGKKCYVIAVGKLNVPKLANFLEVDIFVLVACPENSLLDNAEFYRPVITPYELELACNPDREWTGEFIADYQQLLPGGAAYREFDSTHSQVTMDVSLVTGGVRQLGMEADDDKQTPSTALAPRDNMAVASVSGDFLSSRCWQGLEPNLGHTPVTKAVQGTTGIAQQYASEPTN